MTCLGRHQGQLSYVKQEPGHKIVLAQEICRIIVKFLMIGSLALQVYLLLYLSADERMYNIKNARPNSEFFPAALYYDLFSLSRAETV